jgi:hypothetical protein
MTIEEKLDIWRYNFEQLNNKIVDVVHRTKTRWHIILENGQKVEDYELSTRKQNIEYIILKYSNYLTIDMLAAYEININKKSELYSFLKEKHNSLNVDYDHNSDTFLLRFTKKTISYRYYTRTHGVREKEIDIFTFPKIKELEKPNKYNSIYLKLNADSVFGYLTNYFKDYLKGKFVLDEVVGLFEDYTSSNGATLFEVENAFKVCKSTEDYKIKECLTRCFTDQAINKLNIDFKKLNFQNNV